MKPDSPKQERGIILLCHGSRDPEWLAPFAALREAVAAACPNSCVRLACLQFCAPSLAGAGRDLYGAGVRDVVVVPVFLSRGGHVTRDLPDELKALADTLTGMRFRLTPAIGEMTVVRTAIARAIANAITHSDD